MGDRRASHNVAYRAVLLAAGLLVFGLLFQQLVTLFLAVVITAIVAIPLAACATRLERRGIPRAIGALVALLGGLAAFALLIYLLIPPFVDQSDAFVQSVPGIVDDLRGQIKDLTGADPGRGGERIQDFVERYANDPARLVGPLTSIGLGVAGVLGAFLLVLITAYYMALRPEPLVNGMLSLLPPHRRGHALHVLERLRQAWIGWMQGVLIDMVVTGVLLYVGLSLVGLDFAVFFAIATALLVVVPYFGAAAGALLSTLFALTDSPGKAAVVLLVFMLVQQIESNVIIPVVMSQRVRLHPAVIAIGVLVVGQLFGFVGLFVAVPILSLIMIGVEELWVRPMEDGDRRRARAEIELPAEAEPAAAEIEVPRAS